jgi:DNA-binding IclR family transcriptional regulator
MANVQAGGSRTLGRGLEVLKALSQAPDGATVAALSTRTGLDRAVLYRLLDTLTAEGFAVRDSDTRRFHLGVSVIELGIRATRQLDVRRYALPGMRSLMEQAHEAVCLAVRDRRDVVVVDRVEPRGLSARVNYPVGTRHALVAGAHGRALLFQFEPELRRDLGASPELSADLETSRTRGYALSLDEIDRGVVGVAAPIVGRRGRPVASVGVVAPSARLRDPATLGPRVRALARDVSRRLVHPPVPVG